MWREPYRRRFEDAIHRLLWAQWTALGVAGAGAMAEGRVVDPEALLLFTLEAARTEPRLFDEVLDWLLQNGAWIDVQRLRNLLASDPHAPAGLVVAVAKLLRKRERSAKWRRLSALTGPPRGEIEPLFLPPAAIGPPPSRDLDTAFAEAGYARGPIHLRGLSIPVPLLAPPSLRLRLRALFGIGIRAEIVVYLLSNVDAHAHEVAAAIAYSVPGTQQALREMSLSNLVQVRRHGREKRHSLDVDRWKTFLGVSATGARWVNWSALFQGLAKLLRHFRRTDLADASEYLHASEFVRAFTAALVDLEKSGLPVRPPARTGERVEACASSLAVWLVGWASLDKPTSPGMPTT